MMNSEFRFAISQKTMSQMPLGVRIVAGANLLAAALFIWCVIDAWNAPVSPGFERFHWLLVFLCCIAGALFLAVVVGIALRKVLLAAILERAAFFALAVQILARIALGSIVENEGVFGFLLIISVLFLTLFAAVFYRCSVYLRQVGHMG